MRTTKADDATVSHVGKIPTGDPVFGKISDEDPVFGKSWTGLLAERIERVLEQGSANVPLNKTFSWIMPPELRSLVVSYALDVYDVNWAAHVHLAIIGKALLNRDPRLYDPKQPQNAMLDERLHTMTELVRTQKFPMVAVNDAWHHLAVSSDMFTLRRRTGHPTIHWSNNQQLVLDGVENRVNSRTTVPGTSWSVLTVDLTSAAAVNPILSCMIRKNARADLATLGRWSIWATKASTNGWNKESWSEITGRTPLPENVTPLSPIALLFLTFLHTTYDK